MLKFRLCWGSRGSRPFTWGHAVLDRESDRHPFLRRYRNSAIAISIVALFVAALLIFAPFGSRTSDTASSPPATTHTSTDYDFDVDLHQPFVATPAAGWADGAAGIVEPMATKVGPYSEDQVAEAYRQVRQVLITARLDRAVLEEHDFERFLRLFAPDAQAFMRPEFSDPARSTGYATRIPKDFRLLPVEPKVKGEMRILLGEDGELVVRTNYVFAYAFHTDEPEQLVDAMDIVAVDQVDADYLIYDDQWEESGQGIWPGDVEGFGYSVACEAYENGYLAPYYSERHYEINGDTETDDPEQHFDPDHQMVADESCED